MTSISPRFSKLCREGEDILRKPRIYIGDGSSGKYAVPDFAVYNTKTGQITRIVDAKDGAAMPTKAQEQLNTYGGVFKGSSRAPKAVPQAIPKGKLEVERTNVSQSNCQ